VAVATSGGRDSTALLHLTARVGKALGIEVVALHVNHGLQPAADAWQGHVVRQARRWGIEVLVHRLPGAPARGESVEAWARRGRYAALAGMARAAGCSAVLLAHHRRDQAETFLLQALRGGGAAGLAAMPRSVVRDGLTWLRPWLGQPRAAIDAYLARHRLRPVDDPSNADPRWARSRLRLRVWPPLLDAFPDAEQALAAAAARAAEEAAVLGHLLDGEVTRVAGDPAALRVADWQRLDERHRAAVLRRWLAGLGIGAVPGSLVRRLCAELPRAASARWPCGTGELRVHRGQLRWSAIERPAVTGDSGGTQRVAVLDLSLPGRHPAAGWGGAFDVREVAEGGLAPGTLRGVELRERRGGERIRLTPRGLPRSLKKQYQARGVAAWLRHGPLLFDAEQRLLFAPGLGIDTARQAVPGEPQLGVTWKPDSS
jgi:tRNA(Ile)-lysidine synthase